MSEIIAFHDHKYGEITKALEGWASQVQEEEMKVATPRQARRAVQVKRYVKDNGDTKVALAQKHAEFKGAVKSGDYFKANVIKTEVNVLLGKERAKYFTLFHRLSEAVFSELFSEPAYHQLHPSR